VNKARASLGVQDEIKVGYAPSGTVEILPGALRVFQGKFPRARVVLHDLSVEEMVPKLLQKEMHIALTVPPLKVPRELGMKELERYDICAAVGSRHALARSKFVSLEQMAGEPVLVYNQKDYPDFRKHLDRMFKTVARQPRIGSEHDGVTSLLASVAAGNGFALVPSCVSGMAGPRIKLLKLQPALPPIPIVALWRKDSETEIVRAFVAAASPKPAK
jgi:DNA-binding transcriptional LysR family regulator